MARTPVDLSVVVVTWNSRDKCLECLKSVFAVAAEASQPFEVLVIDNGSHDGTVRAVAAAFPAARIVVNKANRGVAAARNQGIREASGRAILLLDADAYLQPHSLTGLTGAVAGPGVGIAGPRLQTATGTLQYTARRFPTLAGKISRRSDLRWLRRWRDREELRGWDHATPRDVDYVIGACQMIRAEVFDDIGLLDERIFYGPEDVDFCLRAKLAGWRVVYEPAAVVNHDERRITRASSPNTMLLRHAIALAYYFWKHKYLLSTKRLERRIRERARAPVTS